LVAVLKVKPPPKPVRNVKVKAKAAPKSRKLEAGR